MKINKDQVYIIIPAYNEGQVIGEVIDQIKKEGYKNIIVVDDGSTDNTGKIAEKKGCLVLRHIINCGQGAALETGFEYCRRKKVNIVVTFDADGQFLAKEIEKVVRPLIEDKIDIVLGSRFLGKAINMSLKKKIILKLGIIFTNIFSSIGLTDTHNGFRALNKKALEKIKITYFDMTHASDIINQIKKNNLSYKEVPVTIYYGKYHTIKGQKITNSINIFFNLIFDIIFK